MNTSDAREQRANEEIDIELEYERITKQRYEDFQDKAYIKELQKRVDALMEVSQ